MLRSSCAVVLVDQIVVYPRKFVAQPGCRFEQLRFASRGMLDSAFKANDNLVLQAAPVAHSRLFEIFVQSLGDVFDCDGGHGCCVLVPDWKFHFFGTACKVKRPRIILKITQTKPSRI